MARGGGPLLGALMRAGGGAGRAGRGGGRAWLRQGGKRETGEL